jgi:hypothetical protein
MKGFMIFAACLLVCSIVAVSSAEIYLGITPFKALGDVKNMFPGAEFKKLNPAWAKEDDAMYSVTGEGIAGKIIIMFHDTRPLNREYMNQETDDTMRRVFKEYSERSDDDSLLVSWVRWVPDEPFPVERLIAKYGKPERSDFSSVDFKPYNQWKTKGIYAHLSDDGENVVMITYNPTEKELKEADDARVKIVVEKPLFFREHKKTSPTESEKRTPGMEEQGKEEAR